MIKIVALYGKAGAGKDTLLQAITHTEDCPYHEKISCTTRPPREGEEDGVNYHFCTEEEFKNLTLLEEAHFREWFYGTALEDLDVNKINIGVFNIDGIRQLKANENIELLTIYIYASDRVRLLRQLFREENPDVKEIIRRFSTDEQDFDACDFTPDLFCDNSGETDINTICSSIISLIDTRFGRNTIIEEE